MGDKGIFTHGAAMGYLERGGKALVGSSPLCCWMVGVPTPEEFKKSSKEGREMAQGSWKRFGGGNKHEVLVSWVAKWPHSVVCSMKYLPPAV